MSAVKSVGRACLAMGLAVVVGCAGEAAEEDEGSSEGAQNATTATAYMVSASLDQSEASALDRALGGSDNLLLRRIPKTAQIAQKVGDWEIGVGCEYDHNAGSRLCSFFVPYKASAPLVSGAADTIYDKSFELSGAMTFGGPVAKTIFDGIGGGSGERRAGALTCKPAGSLATCTLAAQASGKRRTTIYSMEGLVKRNKISQPEADVIARMAQ